MGATGELPMLKHFYNNKADESTNAGTSQIEPLNLNATLECPVDTL